MKKSFICSFYAQPFPAFQFSYHSMECTDMIDKNEAVAGRDHAIHVSLTVRFLNIPNGKWMISVLYIAVKTSFFNFSSNILYLIKSLLHRYEHT